MKILLDDLLVQKIITGKYQIRSLDLNVANIVKEPINIAYSFVLEDEYVDINISTSGNLYLNCDRCMDEYAYKIDLYENLSLGLKEFGTEYDVDEEARHYIILSFPLKLTCKTDCKGLCPKCGKNQNTTPCTCKNEIFNPKFEKLKSIKF